MTGFVLCAVVSQSDARLMVLLSVGLNHPMLVSENIMKTIQQTG